MLQYKARILWLKHWFYLNFRWIACKDMNISWIHDNISVLVSNLLGVALRCLAWINGAVVQWSLARQCGIRIKLSRQSGTPGTWWENESKSALRLCCKSVAMMCVTCRIAHDTHHRYPNISFCASGCMDDFTKGCHENSWNRWSCAFKIRSFRWVDHARWLATKSGPQTEPSAVNIFMGWGPEYQVPGVLFPNLDMWLWQSQVYFQKRKFSFQYYKKNLEKSWKIMKKIWGDWNVLLLPSFVQEQFSLWKCDTSTNCPIPGLI